MTAQRPRECELRSADRPVWSWQSTSPNQCAELAGRCSIRSHAATGPCDLGSVVHDHPAADGREVDYDNYINV